MHQSAALTLAVALVVGMIAQALALHLGVPGIVLLLLSGVLLGPDVSGIVRPELLGGALSTVVDFAVAVILFDGAMGLDLKRLRREAPVIRRLIVVGGLVTAVGTALAARLIMGWPWTVAIPFGALLIVSGPTVVTPLLRDAGAAGCRTINGLGMLVHQGALSFQLWTGRKAPVAVMERAAKRLKP